MNFPIREISATSGEPSENPQVVAVHRAAARAFRQPAPSEETLRRLLAGDLADELRAAVVHDPSIPEFALAEDPVATFVTFEKTMNVGGGRLLETLLITDVTVRPTHRRRGLLRQLMTERLDEARRRGLALAALTATEGGIYRRFGFGVALQEATLCVDTGPGFSLDVEATGRVELVPRERARAVMDEVFARRHRTHRGSIDRLHSVSTQHSGEWDFEQQRPSATATLAVHLDVDDTPDGYVVWEREPDSEREASRVLDLVTCTAAAQRTLWVFLGSLDLTRQLTWTHASPRDELPLMATDPRRARLTDVRDQIWLRVLDLPVALGARAWDADGRLVLDVADDLGLVHGAWLLEVTDGAATVARLAGDAHEAVGVPTLRLDAAALGSLYGGTVTAHELAVAGRAAGDHRAIAVADDLFTAREPVVNLSLF